MKIGSKSEQTIEKKGSDQLSGVVELAWTGKCSWLVVLAQGSGGCSEVSTLRSEVVGQIRDLMGHHGHD